MAKPKKTSSKLKVDFKGVESGGKLVPEGDYTVKVDEVTQEESDAGNPYLAWVLKVADGKHKGSTLYHNTSLQPQALWNLKGVLEALGVEVPDSSLDIDLKELVGMTAGVTVEHETYQGKPKARIVSWDSSAGGDDDEEEEDDEEGKVTADDVNEMDDEELEALVENNELDVKLSKLKNIKARRAAVIEVLGLNEEEESEDEGDEEATDEDEGEEEGEEAEGEDEEDEEDGDDGYTDEAINEMGKPELAAVAKKHKLKVTLEGTTAQQRRALKKALIRAELFNAGEA